MLSKKDYRIILDALIFKGTADCCSDYSKKRAKRCIRIAKEIKAMHDVEPTKKICIYEGIHEDEWTSDVIRDFDIKVKS